jgi:hypothetical protein
MLLCLLQCVILYWPALYCAIYMLWCMIVLCYVCCVCCCLLVLFVLEDMDYIYLSIYIFIMCLCVCVRVCVCVCVYGLLRWILFIIRIYICICIYVYIYIYMCVCVCMYIYIEYKCRIYIYRIDICIVLEDMDYWLVALTTIHNQNIYIHIYKYMYILWILHYPIWCDITFQCARAAAVSASCSYSEKWPFQAIFCVLSRKSTGRQKQLNTYYFEICVFFSNSFFRTPSRASTLP